MFVFELFSKLNNFVFNSISAYQINAYTVWIAFNTFADGHKITRTASIYKSW